MSNVDYGIPFQLFFLWGVFNVQLGNNRVINASAIRPDNPPGICLRSVELEAAEPHLCYRGLTPTTFRALRVLSNSALLCAALVFDDQGLHGLVNRAFERPPVRLDPDLYCSPFCPF